MTNLTLEIKKQIIRLDVRARGPSGRDGDSILLQNNGTHVQWKRDTESSEWTNLIALSDLKGDAVQFMVDESYIYWKYPDDLEWTQLIALSELKGEKGDQGDPGEPGTPVELTTTDGSVYWRYVGDSVWQLLIPIESIKGEDGTQYLWRGEWANNVAYDLNDCVENEGSGYICVDAHTSGAFATDLAAGKWGLLVSKGDQGSAGPEGPEGPAGPQGAPGTQYSWRGAWTTGISYALNDCIERDGSGYVCTTAHTSGAFATDLAAGKWGLLVLGSSSVTVLMPYGVGNMPTTQVATALNSNTTMAVGLIRIDAPISVNKITIRLLTVTTAGTLLIGIWREDGQVRFISTSVATNGSNNAVTTTLGSPVALSPGNYWIGILPSGTCNTQVACFQNAPTGFRDVTSEPKIEGTYTTAASTLPSTITLASISGNNAYTPYIRLDS